MARASKKGLNPVYWTKGKQAPATRTIWDEYVMFHVTGTNDDKDFTDFARAEKLINCGREVTAYYQRNGFIIKRNVSLQGVIASDNAGMTPTVSKKYIATVKRNCPDFDKLMNRIVNALDNNGKSGQTNSF